MDIVTQIILPLGLAFIMFSMGLSLVIDDFKRVAKFPKAFLIGSALQLITLPVFAYILTKIWMSSGSNDPAFAVGIMILAACPGGVTSNLMTHLSKGDTALSISLTAILSVLSVFTIPFIVNFGYSAFMSSDNSSALPVGKTIIGIFCITTVPVLLGMIINFKKPEFAKKFEPKARNFATLLFIVIVSSAIIKKWAVMETSFDTVGPIVLLLNIGTMFLAYWVSRIFKLTKKQSIAITFECGLQNGTLAIMIAVTFLKNELMMIPGGIYSLIMFITGIGYMLYLMRKPDAELIEVTNP